MELVIGYELFFRLWLFVLFGRDYDVDCWGCVVWIFGGFS